MPEASVALLKDLLDLGVQLSAEADLDQLRGRIDGVRSDGLPFAARLRRC